MRDLVDRFIRSQSQRRFAQSLHIASCYDGISVAIACCIQQPDVLPDIGGSLRNLIRSAIGIVLDMHICQEHPAMFQASEYESQKRQCTEVRRHVIAMKGIQNDGVVPLRMSE